MAYYRSNSKSGARCADCHRLLDLWGACPQATAEDCSRMTAPVNCGRRLEQRVREVVEREELEEAALAGVRMERGRGRADTEKATVLRVRLPAIRFAARPNPGTETGNA